MYILSSADLPLPIYDDALLEIVTCHGLLYGINEKTLGIQLKNLIRRGEIETAEKLLSSLPTREFPMHEQQQKLPNHDDPESVYLGLKLRTFLPLFQRYCQMGDAESMLRLYRRMQAEPRVYFDAEAYILLLSSLARHGYFKVQENADYGPELLDKLVAAMADDVLEISTELAMDLETGFREGFSNNIMMDISSNGPPILRFENCDNSVSLGDRLSISGDTPTSVFVERVEIPQNRTCPKTGTKLRLISLDESQRQHVHDTLLEMAEAESQEFAAKISVQKKRKEQPGDAQTQRYSREEEVPKDGAYQALLKFSDWLE
jgi:pentatricopeptide repeat protein